MATTDIAPVVARLETLISAIADIGPVYPFDLYSHEDLAPYIVTSIDGQRVLRAWWISGPTMRSSRAVSAGELERTWEYQIHGIEGVTESGDSIETLRANALKVTDAIDATTEHDLGGTCHRTAPAEWKTRPENRVIIGGIGVAYVQITKTVTTRSLP